ncbi:DNA polymerase III subunits gamma and tau [hydrothermal vent metagenome]|uniref:DNA-directed DNA polymerase n=1 Tax=hydrothermal vent metagenome TaxID=652676 RepID=A0A1W1EA61_9ZZZZ
MSLALARKYRPATFNDLIGQEAVSQTLSLALDNGRLSHAYLFSGLRGSGKTSTARIFAKALLCEKGPGSHPCGECTHCVMASENRHMDIIEMDAASNRGIDDIKDLIEHTKYKPSSARFKIFIIDEVHMLTNQAFNALLKTLEEPPNFVKFILATTDPLKLPATILSRTQHFRFKKIPQQLVQRHLEHILNLEQIGFEKEAVEIIARSGAGSLRDSLTLLDQAIVYSQNFVDVATVTGMLGIIEPGLLEKLLEDIVKKDTPAILSFIQMAADYEAEMILDELTLYLKSLLLEGSNRLTPMIIERFFRIIAESKTLLSLGSDGEFVLSLTLFKMMEALQIKDIDTMIKGLEQELKGVEVSKIVVATPTPDLSAPKEEEKIAATLPTEQKTEEPAPAKTAKEQEETHPAQKAIPEQAEVSAPVSPLNPAPTKKTENQNRPEASQQQSPSSSLNAQHSALNIGKFTELISKIYDRDYDLGSCFERNITFVSFADDILTWESTAEDTDRKMLITHWGVINMFVKELFGVDTKIKNIAKKKAKIESREQGTGNGEQAASNTDYLNAHQPPAHNDADSDSMIEELEMKSSCIAPDAGDTEAAKEKDPSTLLEEPMVKTALELFNPKKVRIKRNV